MHYILSLTAASIAAVVVELLAPRGEGGRLASSVRMTAGLFLLVALLSPLRAGLELLTGLAEGSLELPAAETVDYGSTWQGALVAMGERELVAWAVDALYADFSVPPAHAEVIPVFAEDGDALPPPLSELCIVLHGASVLEDPHPIEEYFTAALGVPCRVTVALT